MKNVHKMLNDAGAEHYLSTREAAQLLGVALRTAQLWVESGRLAAWKTAGGHRRIALRSVNALLAEREESLARGPVHVQAIEVTAQVPRKVIDLLVVEDDPTLMRLYEYHVENWGFPVRLHQARNGFEGLRLLGEHHPDILISDLNMPGIDGFRMLRTVVEWEDFQDMLTIVVTALSPEDVADRGGLPPKAMLFTKPAPFARLGSLVREHVQDRFSNLLLDQVS